MTAETAKWEWLLAPGLLLLLLLLFFAAPLLNGVVLAPADGIAQDLPHRMLAAEALKHGEMPFWNPFNFSGTPLLATIQVGLFFPANWGFFFLPYGVAMNVAVLAGYWLAGSGTYGLARELRMPPAAAMFSALAFMLGGYLIQNLEHVMMLHAAGMMPFLLWLVARFARTGDVRCAQAGAFVVALLFLAGHPQMAAYAFLLTGAYALYRGWGLPRAERLPYGLGLSAMFALGLGLTSFQLLITLDLIAASQRQAISYAKLTTFSLPPHGLASLFVPFLFGVRHPVEGWAAPFWGQLAWQYWAHAYAGLVTMMGAMTAIAAWKPRPEVRFWGGASGLTLLLMLGDHTPFFRLWALVPVVKMMPYPHRHGLEFTLCLAILAGLGLTLLLKEADSHLRRRAALIGVGASGLALAIILLAVAVAGPGFAARTQALMPGAINLKQALSLSQATFWLPLVLLVVTGVCLLALARRPHPALGYAVVMLLAIDLGAAGYFNGRWHQAPVRPNLATNKLYTFSESRHLTIPSEPYPYHIGFERLRALHYPNFAAFEGIRSVNGYDAFILARYGRLLGLSSVGYLSSDDVWKPGHHVLDMVGLKILRLDPSQATRPEWRARLTSERFVKLTGQGPLLTVENLNALPRAWRPEKITRLTADAVDRKLTQDPRYEPLLETLVEQELPKRVWSEGNAEARTVGLNRLALTTSAPGPGLVVVSESYDPGWRAFAGPRELPVYRANGILLGVEVPEGHVEVTLVYEPRFWKAGLALSMLALALWAYWVFWAHRRRRPS